VIVASFSNRTMDDYRIGLPRGGSWVIRLNSDWKGYSPDFSDVSNPDGQIIAEKSPYDGCNYSGSIALPSYGFLVLSQEQTCDEPDQPDEQIPPAK
jgi:1,4-alpha-glucan branching enzyme